MSLTTVRTLLFDFDYTLVDSSPGVIDCIAYALEQMGLPPVSPEAACRTIGLSLGDTLHNLVGDEHAGRRDQFARLFVQRADEVMADRTGLLPGVPETVEVLVARGYRMGIVSTKYRRRIEGILRREGLAEPFATVVGGEDVTHHKPHPESLRLALAQLASAPRNTLYVGDSVTDAQAAGRAGLSFVAVLTGTTRRAAFAPYDTRVILGSVTGLPALLDGRR